MNIFKKDIFNDLDKLKNQPLFSKTKLGDKVLRVVEAAVFDSGAATDTQETSSKVVEEKNSKK